MARSRLFLVQVWQLSDGERFAVLGCGHAAAEPQWFDSVGALAAFLSAPAEPIGAQHAVACAISPRESEVALLFAGGASHKRIALQLGLAPATVRNHLSACYRKLGVDNRAALLRALTNPHERGPALVHLHHGAAAVTTAD